MLAMPKILECDAEHCAYNADNMCHALAINVGGSEAVCNAFVHASPKCPQKDAAGAVGACSKKDCGWNDCLSCTAPSIDVRWKDNRALCDTFVPR